MVAVFIQLDKLTSGFITGFKIKQTFVTEKNILLMASSLFKWLVIAAFNMIHPFHVSTTEINHNATDKTLEITCRIFTDDFENILRKNYKVKVDLSDPKEKDAMDKLVSDYVKKNLQLKTDGKVVNLAYLGFEIQDAAVNTYLQVENISSVKKIEAVNSLMYDMFDDQMSIMHVIVGGNRKSTKLDYPDTEAKFEF